MDITGHNRLERELQQRGHESAEARMRSIVDHILDGIITIDSQGTLTTFNLAAEKLFRYTAAEVIGRNVKLLMPEPYHSRHDGYIADYLCKGRRRSSASNAR